MNATEIFQPKIAIQDIPMSKIHSLIKPEYNIPSSDNQPFVIHDSAELNDIMKSTRETVEKAEKKVNLKDLQIYSSNKSMFSGLISYASALSTTVVLVIVGIIVLRKFNLFGFLIKWLIEKSTSVETNQNGQVTIHLESLSKNVK